MSGECAPREIQEGLLVGGSSAPDAWGSRPKWTAASGGRQANAKIDKGIRTSTDLDLRQVMCYERQSCAPQLGVKTLECGKTGDVKSDGECVCSRLKRRGGAGPRERTIEWNV